MVRSIVFGIALLASIACYAACGGSTNNAPATVQDAGTTMDAGGTDMDAAVEADAPPPLDHGKPSTTYPAFKPAMGQLAKNSGPVLTAPVVVTITWDTDPNQADLESFGDLIGASDYWKAIGSEYGVGAATSGATNHVRVPVTMTSPLPASFTETSIEQFVTTNAGSGTSGWPAPTSQTIYIVYVHPDTVLDFGGGTSACDAGIGGYHASAIVNGNDVAYAIVPRCNFRSAGALATTTESASHELGEAATDPFPQSLPGLQNFEPAYAAFDLFQAFNNENGDACEFFDDSFYMETAPFAFQVQRQWSNANGAAGHSPCAPAPPGAYFNTTPLALEDVVADLRTTGIHSKGFRIQVGETKTIAIGYYSDGPIGPWNIGASEGNPILGIGARNMTITTDKKKGQNGEIAYVTVTVKTAGSTLGSRRFPKANFITVLSTLGAVTHYMPILIVN